MRTDQFELGIRFIRNGDKVSVASRLKRKPSATNEYNDLSVEAFFTMIKRSKDNPILIEDILKWRDENGCTLLFYAIKYNDLEMISILIDNELSLTEPNCQKITPIDLILSTKNIEILKLLVEKRVEFNDENINVANRAFQDAADGAIQQGEFDIINQLITLGAHVKAKTKLTIASYTAIDKGNYELISLLIDLGADCGMRTYLKGNLLDYAVSKQDPRSIELLIKKWPEISAEHAHEVNDMRKNYVAGAVLYRFDGLNRFRRDAVSSNKGKLLLDVFSEHYDSNDKIDVIASIYNKIGEIDKRELFKDLTRVEKLKIERALQSKNKNIELQI